MRIILITGLIIVLATSAYSACLNDYKTRPVEEEYQTSECVLIVQVVGKQRVYDSDGFLSHQKYDLVVIDRLKGKCSDKLTFLDDNDSGRFDMMMDYKYLVFIQDIKSIDILSCCGNSGLLSAKQEVLQEMRKSNHGLESTGAPPAAGTPETHP